MARGRRQLAMPAGLVVAVVLLVVLAIAAERNTHRNDPTPAQISAANASDERAAEASKKAASATLAGRTVLFVGDSWTAGYGASNPSHGFVALTIADLSLNAKVLSNSGAGWAHVSPTQQTMASLVAQNPQNPAPDLVVIMAGVNDAAEPATKVTQGARDTFGELRTMYPKALVLVLGPMPPSEKSVAGMTAVGAVVGSQASMFRDSYIDTIGQRWLPEDQLGQLINPAKLYHPNDAGHRQIADHLEAVIRPLLPKQ